MSAAFKQTQRGSSVEVNDFWPSMRKCATHESIPFTMWNSRFKVCFFLDLVSLLSLF